MAIMAGNMNVSHDAWITALSPDDSSTTAPNVTEESPDCSTFVFVNYVVIFGTICIFGLVGNSLSLIVMISERGSHVARFLLEVMAVTDNCFLATAGFAQIVQAILVKLGDVYNPVLAYSAVIVWPLVLMTQMASVWMVVLVAFNRYVAICRPFQAPMLCTRKRVRIQIASIIAFVIVYNLPRFFEHVLVYDVIPPDELDGGLVSDSTSNETVVQYYLTYNETALKRSKVYNILYENVLYSFFVFLGPLAVLIAMNTCLIRELAHVRQRMIKQNLPTSGEEDEQGLTMTMIVIILVFIICQTPAFFNQMLFLAIGAEHCIPCLPYYYYYQLSNVVVSTNSSANFVIYCVFRRQFRERLARLCFSWCKKKRSFSGSKRANNRSYADNEDVTSVSLNDNDHGKGGHNNGANVKNGNSSKPPPYSLEMAEVTAPLNPNGGKGVSA